VELLDAYFGTLDVRGDVDYGDDSVEGRARGVDQAHPLGDNAHPASGTASRQGDSGVPAERSVPGTVTSGVAVSRANRGFPDGS
jgi:hypothetical protein